MSDSRLLNVVFCWHMHQPDYRNYANGEFMLPWTYLHAVKDYTDMAFHLEQNPQARAVVNFVPVLLDQLEAYVEQFDTGQIRDPLLRLLIHEDLCGLDRDSRELLLDRCFRCNHTKMIEPFPAYQRLLKLYQEIDAHEDKHFAYLSDQYFADLLTWYHLSWTGESVRRTTELLPRLMSQGALFDYEDRRQLFELYGDLIRNLIPRYRKLMEMGRIEISTTPHYHPIAPLLLDIKSGREAQPAAPLPEAASYPGGVERVSFHVDSALASHAARFGQKPVGMWPAEGAVSQATLSVLAQHGVRWAATGEGVLVNSLRQSQGPVPDKLHYMYRPYVVQANAAPIHCFFRDDRLSDLIGFEYAKWFARDAVSNFVHELETVYQHTPQDENPLVSIILDGENAWEYYPYNGYYFLSEVYEALAAHPYIRMTTFGAYLDQCGQGQAGCAKAGTLSHVVAGSWVYGNLSTWIGDHDKNHAWDLLCAAKQSYDQVMASGRLSAEAQQAASKQLADCESSDWFWWFGDYNPAASVASFDALFRGNLTHLYELLHLPVPPALSHPISRGGTSTVETGGTMRRGID